MTGPRTPITELPPSVLLHQLNYERFEHFASKLLLPNGRPFELAVHLEEWARLLRTNRRLCLLAPRDHAKTTIVLAYILWQWYRHATDRATGASRSKPGPFQAVLVSATVAQARVLMSTFRDLLAVNTDLMSGPAGTVSTRAVVDSARHVRLATGAELLVRAYRTSLRGLHPDLLLLDDVLSDQNSGTQDQRRQTWGHFIGTLLPMHARQIVIVGTAFHADDLLHRLQPEQAPGPDRSARQAFDFKWVRYRALLEDERTTLWPARHPYAELAAIREREPAIFAREYQNDPRDEIASMFPRSLTDHALDAGKSLAMVDSYRPTSTEIVVMGVDLAVSEAIGADYTAAIVVAWDLETDRRRVLTIRRHRGLTFRQQVALLEDLCASYGITLGIVEQNGFQSWLIDELRDRPAGSVIHGFTTGRQKADLIDGVARLKLPLVDHRWVMPNGDEPSRSMARIWQDELAAFGWRGDRLAGFGEHDDTVMASWFVEVAIARVQILRRYLDEQRIYTMEDLGIKPVVICEWDDPRHLGS